MKKLVSLLLILCLAVAAAGCGDAKKESAGTSASAKENAKVSLAMLRLTSSAPLFIAMDKGFFQDEGIEIDPQWIDAAQAEGWFGSV